MEELDLPEDECFSDKTYNFNSCVRKSLSRQVEPHKKNTKKNTEKKHKIQVFQVGCRTKWDVWSDADMVPLPLCNSINQYR